MERSREGATEPSSSSQKHFDESHVGKKRLEAKVNKCVRVDMDLEEEPLREVKSCPDAVCLSEVRTEALAGAPRTYEDLPSFQLVTTPPASMKGPPPLPLLHPPLRNVEKAIPPPPPPPPPLPVPGERTSLSCSQPLSKDGEDMVYESTRISCCKKERCPTLRMKPFNWETLPLDIVKGNCSLWASAAAGNEQTVEPDYASIERRFCVPQTSRRETATPEGEELKEVSFVDPMKSLHLNIVLKQFKCYHLRIECMLTCAEASATVDLLRPKAKLARAACETLLTNPRLPVFCQLILKVGNFLNYGRHTGNAGGFKMDALLKLTETRANQACVTLLHHILEEVEKNHRDLLQLPDDLECVSKAAGISFQDMQTEADVLLKRLLETERKISLSESDVKAQFGKSIKDYINASKELAEEVKALSKKKAELADYLCEDRNATLLEDVFNTMKSFRTLFSKALKENQDRRKQAAMAEKRKQLFEKEKAKRQKL